MPPSMLLVLWFANWAVTSTVAVSFVKNAAGGAGSSRPDLWGLEKNLPGLVAWLILAWPVALVRLLPAVSPIRRGGAGRR